MQRPTRNAPYIPVIFPILIFQDEFSAILLVDDGTGVIQCVHFHPQSAHDKQKPQHNAIAQKRPQESQASEFPAPRYEVGDILRMSGRVEAWHDMRQIIINEFRMSSLTFLASRLKIFYQISVAPMTNQNTGSPRPNCTKSIIHNPSSSLLFHPLPSHRHPSNPTEPHPQSQPPRLLALSPPLPPQPRYQVRPTPSRMDLSAFAILLDSVPKNSSLAHSRSTSRTTWTFYPILLDKLNTIVSWSPPLSAPGAVLTTTTQRHRGQRTENIHFSRKQTARLVPHNG